MPMILAFPPKLGVVILQNALFWKSLYPGSKREEGDRRVQDNGSVTYRIIMLLVSVGYIVTPVSYMYLLVRHPAEVMAYLWTPGEIISVAATVSGSLIRFWCFKELGKYFTLQLIVRKDHKLIQTGPYKLVRHPSYTGSFLNMFGFNTFLYAYGWDRCIEYLAPTRSASWKANGGRIVRAVLMMYAAEFIRVIYDRTNREDQMLREEFGQEWDNYAARTKRFIPYVI